MTLEFFSATDTGRVRDNNEDSVALEPGVGLAVLADWLAVVESGGAPQPRFAESAFDGLELEVRRTGRERRALLRLGILQVAEQAIVDAVLAELLRDRLGADVVDQLAAPFESVR